jgi:hypothetical protein
MERKDDVADMKSTSATAKEPWTQHLALALVLNFGYNTP